jgi:hypothetical protein
LPELRTEVWASDQFDRLFVGVEKRSAIQGVVSPALSNNGNKIRRRPAA